MKSNNSLAGLFVMIGLVFMGLMTPVAVSKFMAGSRTVDVKGLCEREVKADKVIWPISHKTVSNDLPTVTRTLDNNTNTIIAFLKKNGITDEEITIAIPKITDKLAQDYTNGDVGLRYLGKAVVTVSSSDVDKVLAAMGKTSQLINGGITINQDDWNYQPSFRFESLNDIKPEMIAEATANARAAADKFAKDSGSKVGKIKKATQGTFSIEDRDECTPQVKKIRVVTYLTYFIKN
ncbi:MAG: SIMPL domain-containing protein [Bacteroidales bacterium]|nr:SIMPL domain-containing protein [Bacteroidales bacterium]